MTPVVHHADDGAPPVEVRSLGGEKWTFFEERYDDLPEVCPSLHGEAKQRLSVVVVAGIPDDLPASELLLEELECGS